MLQLDNIGLLINTLYLGLVSKYYYN